MSEPAGSDDAAEQRAPRRLWPWLLGGVVGLPIFAWFLVSALAQGQDVPWEPGHPVRMALEARHPPTPDNEAASTWDRSATSLGTSVRAPAASQGISPSFLERVLKFERMTLEESALVDSEARAKALEIDGFVAAVIQRGPPRWSEDIEPRAYENLDIAAAVHLHELLLARARAQVGGGDEAAALAAIEAAWSLDEALVARADTVANMTGQVLLWRCLDLLRETSGTPEWCARVAARDLALQTRDVALAESWEIYEEDMALVSQWGLMAHGVRGQGLAPTISQRAEWAVAFIAMPYMEWSTRGGAQRQVSLIDRLDAADPCSGDPIEIGGTAAASLPRWDWLARDLWSNPSFAWVVAAVSEHELEVTRLTWELRGTPCPVGPNACAVEGWTERVEPDGSRILELPEATPATRHLSQALTRSVVITPGSGAPPNGP